MSLSLHLCWCLFLALVLVLSFSWFFRFALVLVLLLSLNASFVFGLRLPLWNHARFLAGNGIGNFTRFSQVNLVSPDFWSMRCT